MRYEWDEAKRIRTLLKRGVDFTDAEKFQWQTAKIIVDERREYTEQRFVATGFIEGRLHVMAFTMRSSAIRIISLRKANKREAKNYEETAD
ncbi:MAG: BrnT family toxin [Nitrospirota bacterium]